MLSFSSKSSRRIMGWWEPHFSVTFRFGVLNGFSFVNRLLSGLENKCTKSDENKCYVFIKFLPNIELHNSFIILSSHWSVTIGAIKLTSFGWTSYLIFRPLVRLASIFRFILFRKLCNLIHFLKIKRFALEFIRSNLTKKGRLDEVFLLSHLRWIWDIGSFLLNVIP